VSLQSVLPTIGALDSSILGHARTDGGVCCAAGGAYEVLEEAEDFDVVVQQLHVRRRARVPLSLCIPQCPCPFNSRNFVLSAKPAKCEGEGFQQPCFICT